MNAKILDGKALSKTILAEIAENVKRLPKQPGIAVILVGDNPASKLYVTNKIRAANEAGFKSVIDVLPEETNQDQLIDLIRRHNENCAIHGYIVQLPLPKHIDQETIICAIDPNKDADGFHPFNQGMLLRGTPRIIPATPRGILELLRRNEYETTSKKIVILGRSTIVGRPLMAALLLNGKIGNATVTVAHSQTLDLPCVCRNADILIVAIGKPRFIDRKFVKTGAVVIDVGINNTDGKLCGDVDFEDVKEVASAITPVPGGIGPMTIAMLLQNTFEIAKET